MIKKLLPLWILIFISTVTTIQAQNVDLYLDTLTVESGNNVTLELTAENFKDIYVLEFVIQWDSTVLQYVSHQDFNDAMGFTSANFATPAGIGRADLFKISWNDPEVKGVDVPDGEVIFSLTFKAIGDNGTQSPVVFTIGPPPFMEWEIVQDFESYTNEEVEEATHDGLVIIESGGGGASSMDLIGSHETVESGDEACVDVSVKGFTDIKAMDVVMRYDESVLKYKKIKNLNLAQLTQGNFTNPTPGEVRLSYNNPTGASVPDNTKIFQVCFDAIGANGTSSDFRFTGGDPNPPLEVVNMNDEVLNVNVHNGSVTIGGSGGDLYLDIEDKEINGPVVYVPIRVSGFTDIVGYTHSIGFDASYMTFDSIRNFAFNPSGLGINDVEADQGKLGFLWATADGQPKSLSDKSILLELCFTLNAGCAGGTRLTFTDDPLVKELYQAPDVEIFPEYRDGNLTCAGKSVTPLVTNVSCGGDCDGEISLDISGWSVESIKWSDSSLPDQAHVTGLCTGTYGVTVTFTDNSQISNDNIVVLQDESPTVSINSIHADLGNAEGSIDIEVNGNSPVFTWSNGETTEDISNLESGTYSVTVGEANTDGCKTVIENIVVLGVDATVIDVSCGNKNDGTISINVSGGSGNYSYAWTCTDDTTASVSELPAGECTVTITDEDGNFSNIATFTISSPPPIELTDVQVTQDDGSGNGAIDITVGGGQEPYTFHWIPTEDTTEDISGLSEGSYIVIITDSRGCSFTSEPIDIGEGGPVIVVNSSSDIYNGYGVACAGDCNGSLEIIPYNLEGAEITWADGSSDFSRTELCPGEYAYTITAGGQTIKSDTIILEEPEELAIEGFDLTCSSGNNGSASVEVSGGTEGAYLYYWEPGLLDVENFNDMLSPGNYMLTVTDLNGCLVTAEYEIKQCENNADCFTGRQIITPNGDGKNDRLVIKTCGDIESASISIYTQWGELIYQADNYMNDWEGKSQSGDFLNDGLYHWVLQVVLSTGETQAHRGSVNLVRTMN